MIMRMRVDVKETSLLRNPNIYIYIYCRDCGSGTDWNNKKQNQVYSHSVFFFAKNSGCGLNRVVFCCSTIRALHA